MASARESRPLLEGLPRRGGAAAAVIGAAVLALYGSFAAEVLPVRPAVDRLYELEAARDGYARAARARLAAREAERAARASPVADAARPPVQARAVPARVAALAPVARDEAGAAPAARPCACRD